MEQQLKKIMSDILGIREEDITDETAMINTRRWDSLKHIELIIGIEEQFGITPQLSMDEIVQMIVFAGMKRVLMEKLA